MASKGWGLFVVMLGLFACVLITGAHQYPAQPVVRVSPQGSTIVLPYNDAPKSSLDESYPKLLTDPLPHFSEMPVFTLPSHEATADDQMRASTSPNVASRGRECELYH